MHGEGEFVWPDGRKYTGLYSKNKKHGKGVFYWTNGKNIEGTWNDGRLVQGKLSLPNGTQKTITGNDKLE